MRKPSRALLIYIVAVLLLATYLFLGARAWSDGGKLEKKMKERQAAHENISLRFYIGVYGPKALYLNSGLCLLLLAAGPLAIRRLQGRPVQTHSDGSPRRVTFAVVALTIAASAVWIAPRLKLSLWADEMTSMRKFTVGAYERDASGEMKFDAITPSERQFALKTPNNHMLYNTVAGSLHSAFAKPGNGPQDTYFVEWILRLPAFLAGLAAIAALAWLASEMGVRRAGWLAVLLLALHPWYIRYTAEARGYSVVMALVPALLASALVAVRTGRWRWWLLFALIQVVMIDTWPLSVDVVIMTNAVVFGMIFTSQWQGQDRWTQWARWGAVSVLGAMGTVQLILPTLPQIFEYIQSQPKYDPANLHLIIDAALGLFTGTPWHTGDPGNPHLFAWLRIIDVHPILTVLFLLVLAVLYVAGLMRLWKSSAQSRWMAILTVLLPVGIMTDLALKHYIFLVWYWVPALPLTLLAMGVGFVALFERSRWMWLVAAPAVLALAAILLIPQHLELRQFPVQANKEAALVTRSILNPTYPGFGKEAITANVSMFYEGYDCDVISVESVDAMQQVIAKAEAAKLPLYVNLSRPNLMQQKAPDLLLMLDDPKYFTKIATLYGTDEESTKWVYLHAVP